MKRKNTFLALSALSAAMFSAASLSSFASEESSPSFFEKLGSNIWYILLAVAFAAGLIIITKWSAKIKARDQQVKEEYDAWKAEHPEEARMLENGETPVEEGSDGSDPEDETEPEDEDGREADQEENASEDGQAENASESDPEN